VQAYTRTSLSLTSLVSWLLRWLECCLFFGAFVGLDLLADLGCSCLFCYFGRFLGFFRLRAWDESGKTLPFCLAIGFADIRKALVVGIRFSFSIILAGGLKP